MPMTDDSNPEKPGDEDAALRARLAKLQEALRERADAKQAEDAAVLRKPSSLGRAMSVGLSAFSEFVGAIVVGGLIGWQGDLWLGTKPWLMVLFLGLGIAAGFWNVYRVAAPKARPGGSEEDQTPDGPA
jgi:ATP synthase protein I